MRSTALFTSLFAACSLYAIDAAALSVGIDEDRQLGLPFNTATFVASVSDAQGASVDYVWSIVSGPPDASIGGFASDPSRGQIVVQNPGTYQIQVRVTTSAGSATDRAFLYVNDHFANTIPGRIEAENANLGNGLGYLDKSPGNLGGAFRDDDVDVQVTGDIGGGFNVGWIQSGERLSYDILSQSGTYDLTVRVASAQSGTKRFRVEINGVDVSGSVSFNTGGAGWQSYQDVVIRDVPSNGYVETLTIIAETGGFNINYLDFELQP